MVRSQQINAVVGRNNEVPCSEERGASSYPKSTLALAFTLTLLLFSRLFLNIQQQPPVLQDRSIATHFAMNTTNGINGHAVAPALWSEARNAEGRVYYYNTITKATQWTKPEDLMTPAEVGFLSYPYDDQMLTYVFSALLQTSLGRSILRREGANTGTIRKRSRAHGRCQMSTRKLCPKMLLPPRLLHRK